MAFALPCGCSLKDLAVLESIVLAVNQMSFVLSLPGITITTKPPFGSCYFARTAEADLTSIQEFSFRWYAV